MVTQRIRAAALLAAGMALAACASTSLVESWKAPGAGPLQFKKVLALAMVENDSIRRTAEDALVGNLRGVQAVPSYQVLGDMDLGNREAMKERVRQEGFDGVVVLSLASADQALSWATAAGPVDFYGYYDDMYMPMVDLSVDTVVRVEINIFSLTEDKLLWAGVSETYNPTSATQLIAQIVEKAGAKLRQQGMISS